MTARACGSSSPAALSGPGEAVHGHHLDPPTPVLVALGEPGLEDLLGPARDHVQKPGRTTAVAHGGQVDHDGDVPVAPPGVAPHTGGTSRTRAKRAGESSTPRTSTPSKRSGLPVMVCSARVRIALLAVCQEIPRAAATRQTDMHSRARARSPHSTAAWVSRVLGSAKVEVSCLHTRRQWVQAKRRRRTTSCVGLHPTGTWARRRTTVPRDTPWAPQALQNGSSNPIGIRHSITARLAVRCWPTAVSPRASSPRKVVRSGQAKVVSGTSRSLVTVV